MRWLLPSTVHTRVVVGATELDRAPQRDFGAVQPAEVVQDLAEHAVVRAEVGLEHHRAPHRGRGFVVALEVFQRLAEVVPRLPLARRDRDERAQHLLGRRAAGRRGAARWRSCCRSRTSRPTAARRAARRLRRGRCARVDVVAVGEERAEQLRRAFVVRLRREHAAVRLLGGREVAGALQPFTGREQQVDRDGRGLARVRVAALALAAQRPAFRPVCPLPIGRNRPTVSGRARRRVGRSGSGLGVEAGPSRCAARHPRQAAQLGAGSGPSSSREPALELLAAGRASSWARSHEARRESARSTSGAENGRDRPRAPAFERGGGRVEPGFALGERLLPRRRSRRRPPAGLGDDAGALRSTRRAAGRRASRHAATRAASFSTFAATSSNNRNT